MTKPLSSTRSGSLAGLAVAALLAAGATFSSATLSSPARADATFFVAPDATRVDWALPGLRPAETPQVAAVGPWARTDYAAFTGRRGQGEVLLKTAMPGPHVFQHPPGLARQAASWNHLRGRVATWFPKRSIQSYGLDVVYQRAALSGGHVCVVFSGEGNTVPLDPQARPGLVILGYYCPGDGGRLTDSQARAAIGALRVRRDDGIDRFGRAPKSLRSGDAVAAARGSARSGMGNARFPFRLATPYPENDGSFERP